MKIGATGLIFVMVAAVAVGDSHYPLNASEQLAVEKIRTYCQACHGVGELRFIYSEVDEEVWDYIHSQPSPKSKKLWATAIAEVLNWPSESAPPFSKPISPDQDWMPKGIKRLQMADDYVGGVSSRRIILENLKKHFNPDEPDTSVP